MRDGAIEFVEGPVRLASALNEGVSELAPENSITGLATEWAAKGQAWAADQLASFKAGRPDNVVAAGVYDEQKFGTTALLSMAPAVAPLKLARPSAIAGEAGTAARGAASGYSVAFETTIARAGAGTRGAHFKAANEALRAEMRASPDITRAIESLGIKVPGGGKSPANWSWHHVPDRPGVMQLVPRTQHQGSAWQQLLHPGRVGGFKLWGAEF